MADLCENKTGWQIYKTVDNVQGYFYGGETDDGHRRDSGCPWTYDPNFCGSGLVYEGFEFVETEGGKLNGFSERNLGEDLGKFRFTLEENGHPNCAPYDAQKLEFENRADHIKKNDFWSGNVSDVPDDKCIARWPIPEITARYEVRFNDFGVHSDEEGWIHEFRLEVRDRTSEELIAHNSKFIFKETPRPDRIRRGIMCPYKYTIEIDGIREVLKSGD